MISFKSFIKLSSAIALLSLITGCMLPSPMSDATSSTPSDSQVILVGKFDINPPIDTEHEQTTRWNIIGDGRMINKILMATGPEASPVSTSKMKFSEWNGSIEAEWGKTFFKSAKREKTYYRGGMMHLDLQDGSKVWFPGGYYFQAPKNAKAIYIGTLKYDRDDFYEIKRIRVIDEYSKASREFKKEFGNIKLHKALLRRAK